MEKLTKKEQIVLQKVKDFMARSEKITVRAIQTALDYASPRSISVLFDALMHKGYIYRDSRDHIQLSPDLTSSSHEVRYIPLIGAIACGMPIFAEENIETEIPVSSSLLSAAKKYFFLRAEGDSMNQKGIDNGDLVLLEESSVPQNGQIVAALINDEATLKEFRQDGDMAYLIPHSDNPQYKPIILGDTYDHFSVQWIFVRVFPGSLFA